MKDAPRLLFVYNADSGLFNTLADIGHKLFSPDTYACALCALTHGYFSERQQWRTFIEDLACPCEFLHRDQFRERYPDDDTRLPAVFVQDRGRAVCVVDTARIRACADLAALRDLIRGQCDALRSAAAGGRQPAAGEPDRPGPTSMRNGSGRIRPART